MLGKPELKRLPGTLRNRRHKHWWEYDIKMDLRKYDGVLWTEFIWLIEESVESSCKYGNKPSGSVKF